MPYQILNVYATFGGKNINKHCEEEETRLIMEIFFKYLNKKTKMSKKINKQNN